MKINRCVLFVATILCIAQSLSAQKTSEEVLQHAREGYDLEQQGKLSEALFKYNQAIAADVNYPYPLQRIGAMYQRLKNYPKAIQFYRRAIALDSTFDDYNYLNLALCYRALKNADSTEYFYRMFILRARPVLPEDTVAVLAASKYVEYIERSAEIRKLPKNTEDPLIITSINSGYNDFAPSITADGKLLVFTSRRPSTNKERYSDYGDFGDDVFYSIKDSAGIWSAPIAVASPINSIDDEGAATITADGQTVFFSLCRRSDGVGDCDLYVSRMQGLTWSTPENLLRPLNSTTWDAQASISADGSTMYFSSRRQGSVANSEDIWVVYKNTDGTWGLPSNVGEVINTDASERSPFIAADNRTLYFSSNGHPGYGEHDLFMTRKGDDGVWSPPTNLGSPINDDREDEFLTIPARGDKILYASQRASSNTDIYEAVLPEHLRPLPVTLIVGTTYDKRTKKPIGAKLELTNLAKDELLAVYNSNSATGQFFITLPVGIEYGVTATARGYAFFSEHYTPPADAKYQELTYDLYLTPVDTLVTAVADQSNTGGKDNLNGDSIDVIPLNNIFFDFNEATLRIESLTELKNIVNFMKEYPMLKIQISGHTDSIGNDTYNKNLSQKRAESVRQYIISNGVAANRVVAKGYGATVPKASNDTEQNRQLNRRTEFIILKRK